MRWRGSPSVAFRECQPVQQGECSAAITRRMADLSSLALKIQTSGSGRIAPGSAFVGSDETSWPWRGVCSREIQTKQTSPEKTWQGWFDSQAFSAISQIWSLVRVSQHVWMCGCRRGQSWPEAGSSEQPGDQSWGTFALHWFVGWSTLVPGFFHRTNRLNGFWCLLPGGSWNDIQYASLRLSWKRGCPQGGFSASWTSPAPFMRMKVRPTEKLWKRSSRECQKSPGSSDTGARAWWYIESRFFRNTTKKEDKSYFLKVIWCLSMENGCFIKQTFLIVDVSGIMCCFWSSCFFARFIITFDPLPGMCPKWLVSQKSLQRLLFGIKMRKC